MKNINLREQNRGSSLPSPQSLILLQYLLRGTQRPFVQLYSEREHCGMVEANMGRDLAVRSGVNDEDDDDDADDDDDDTAATTGDSCCCIEELLSAASDENDDNDAADDDEDDFAAAVVANKQMNIIKNVGSLWYVIIVVAMFVASVDFICKESTITLDFR
ncbi:hypothetical protein FF38_04705 [Lucilia cuprina]|uniref:Uncharacterized protein n=1 Tax=Lucilia cuprina TaxID=7375 RepID=A0A0L0CLJ7_LUCCU|nr:hypothetical protein FF38_04705 [Lucilia cuprina]